MQLRISVIQSTMSVRSFLLLLLSSYSCQQTLSQLLGGGVIGAHELSGFRLGNKVAPIIPFLQVGTLVFLMSL
jgi:hypothetical protein